MKRAGRVHGLRTLAVVAAGLLCVCLGAGHSQSSDRGQSRRLPQDWWISSSRTASTAQVPDHRPATRRTTAAGPIPRSSHVTQSDRRRQPGEAPRQPCPFSGGLPPGRITSPTACSPPPPTELPVLRDALKPHRHPTDPQLWSVLRLAKPDDTRVAPGGQHPGPIRP